MQRRIKKPDRDRKAIHLLEDTLKVLPLIDKELIKCTLLLPLVTKNQLAYLADTFRLEEHVFRPAQSNTIRTVLAGFLRIVGRVGICQDIHSTNLVYGVHEGFQIATNGRWGDELLSIQYLSSVAVETNKVTLLEHLHGAVLHGDSQFSFLLINANGVAATDARATPSTRNDSGVACHATTSSQNALGAVPEFQAIQQCLFMS
mmetsp:Transcript_2573/g.4662  ORF Transcript_2573/g.4662 Transcript_2573/m.4662 type:complete len:203 (+) Transcript_2573:946-1554(+)